MGRGVVLSNKKYPDFKYSKNCVRASTSLMCLSCDRDWWCLVLILFIVLILLVPVCKGLTRVEFQLLGYLIKYNVRSPTTHLGTITFTDSSIPEVLQVLGRSAGRSAGRPSLRLTDHFSSPYLSNLFSSPFERRKDLGWTSFVSDFLGATRGRL